MKNANLASAKVAKNDEFYTQLADIEKELDHYRAHFRGKVVYCNCDDPETSNFWQYFAVNFDFFGLKKLIATHYREDKPTYLLTLEHDTNGNGQVNSEDAVKTVLDTNGDFRSPECIEILKTADIVVTNPPFSLFREFVAQLVEYNKQFIILGNINAITYQEIFPLLKNNQVWLGYKTGAMKFQVPNSAMAGTKNIEIIDGLKYQSLGNIAWYTNVPIAKRTEKLSLHKHYSPEEFPTYVNYNAINVDRVADIPLDYNGEIGVPITFMTKYNPDQFEILALGTSVNNIQYINNNWLAVLNKQGQPTGEFTHNANGTLYRRYNPKTDKAPSYRNADTGELYLGVYARIIIKRRAIKGATLMKNASLTSAKTAKKDEFYTCLTDIEQELQHYRQYFKGKIVYCNCDNPETSNFWRYFAANFDSLGLKKLIATYYLEDKPTYLSTLEHGTNGNGRVDSKDVVKTVLDTNGDFRSPECIELLKEADIVVTNPPFSLFREYVAQLVAYDKQFIVLGNINAITYKEFFPLLKDNLAWLGYKTGAMEFQVPTTYPLLSKSGRVDKDGNKYLTMPSISWYTNIPTTKRNEKLLLDKHYSPEEFPTYDNYDAINVNKVADIPADYAGVMGVPITFMPKYNPDQFEILGITQRTGDPYRLKQYTKDEYPNANDLNARAVLLINNLPKSMYARILIRQK